MKSLIIFFFLMGVFSSYAEIENKSFVLCRNYSNIRTIRVDIADGGKCHTTYTKSGKDKVVGNGNFVSSCTRILDNIKGNLEAASWQCKNVSNASFSKSPDQSVQSVE